MDIFDTLDQPQVQQQQPYQKVNFEGINQGMSSQAGDIFSTLENNNPNENYSTNQEIYQNLEKKKPLLSIPRQATQYASRAAEYIGGIPETMVKGAEYLGEKGANAIRSLVGAQPTTSANEKESSIRFPSSQKLRQISEEKSGGFTSPLTPGEEKTGEFVQRVTGVMLPIGTAVAFPRAVAISAAGMLAKEGVKAAGGKETAQNLADIGASIIAGSVNPGMTRRASDEAYQAATRLRPRDATAPFVAQERSLRRLRTRLERGGTDPDKQAVITKIDEMLGHVQNGRIPVGELEAFHQQFNKMTIDRTLYGARNNLRYMNALTMQSARHYGRQNPQWYQEWSRGNQIHGGVAVGRKIAQKIENTMNKHPLNSSAGGIATLALFGANPAIIVPSLKGAAASYILGHSGALLHQVMRNPELRRLYLNTLNNSIRGNQVNLSKNLTNLSRKMEEELDLSEFQPNQTK